VRFGDFEFDLRSGKLFRGAALSRFSPSRCVFWPCCWKMPVRPFRVNLYEAASGAMRPMSNSTRV
jgi:hypothetical protein